MSTQLTPLRELVNVLESEAMARLQLGADRFAEIAETDRRAFDKMTFRPRMMVDSTKLDLSVELFGEKHFAPILVGPVSGSARFHPEGDSALARGAAGAKAAVILADPEAARRASKPVCVPFDPAAIAALRKQYNGPVIAKGVMTPRDAESAIASGASAVIVSAYRVPAVQSAAAPIEVLPAIVDAVGGRAPVLVDGGFRRGTDIFKALAIGARAVLVARPVLWGLAAYGADGVRYVLETLQTELGRTMVMCGTTDIAAIGRGFVRVHKR